MLSLLGRSNLRSATWKASLHQHLAASRSHPPRLTNRPRFFSNGGPDPLSDAQRATSRFDRILSRLPKFLHKYVAGLRNAPVSHISSFLILHELTAVVPLIGLFCTFHYTNYLPPYFSEGKYIADGVQKFGNYFRRKGWLGLDEVPSVDPQTGDIKENGETVMVGGTANQGAKTVRARWWGRGEDTVRIVVEVATAYTITKALLPARLVLSVWATPWFARVAVLPAVRRLRRLIPWGRGRAK